MAITSRKVLTYILLNLIIFSFLISESECGLLGAILGIFGGYGACQTACNAGWVSCYAAAGLTAGTLTAGVGVPAAAIACNTA